MQNDSAKHFRPAQNNLKKLLGYTICGWLACTAACVVLNAIVLLYSNGWRLDAPVVAAILVLFVDLPIIIPAGVSIGLLAVLFNWFGNAGCTSNIRRYCTAFVLCEVAGIMMLPAWNSIMERIAEGAPPGMVASSSYLQKIKNEQADEIAQVDFFVRSRPTVEKGGCMFGPDFWATGPGDITYIKLLKSLKQLHSIQRCIDSSGIPLVLFPSTVLFALWWMDLRQKKLEKVPH